MGFNRTFMELKYGLGTYELASAAGFNRTFMELKWVSVCILASYVESVLIVPLWN